MSNRGEIKLDSAVLIASALAVLVAATLTMATIARNSQKSEQLSQVFFDSPDPMERAEQAARAGVEAAKWHIECHGRIEAGGLSPKYHINGATYTVAWGDVDLSDSIVIVRSTGNFSWDGKRQYQVDTESKIKIESMPSHGQEILSAYYSRHNSPLITASPE
jgi:hypothetical protein